jgi:hypothetical protein
MAMREKKDITLFILMSYIIFIHQGVKLGASKKKKDSNEQPC